MRPPSSLRKPYVSDTTPNRAFLRGFPATHFLDFGLCGRSRILVVIFGALSLHPKIPFPAPAIEREVRAQLKPNYGCAAVDLRDPGPALQLIRVESERCELSAPFSRRIAEPLDSDAAGQATFYGRFNKIGGEEGERDGHIDLPNATFFASAKLSDR